MCAARPTAGVVHQSYLAFLSCHMSTDCMLIALTDAEQPASAPGSGIAAAAAAAFSGSDSVQAGPPITADLSVVSLDEVPGM